jgi:hypothetical protein
MDSEKIGFNSYEEAREELERIINTNYNVCKMKKPSRVYFSDITKLWHLTSSPNVKVY